MSGRWRKGESGNPNGRPKGRRTKRQQLEKRLVGYLLEHFSTQDEGSELTRGQLAIARLWEASPERYLELAAKLVPKEDTLRIEGEVTLSAVIQEAARLRQEANVLEGEVDEDAQLREQMAGGEWLELELPGNKH